MQILMLGSGSSGGVPRLGGPGGKGDWGSCDPTNPKNRRLRVSIMVEAEDVRLLVDTTPDIREQLLSAEAGWLTAILYTHDHADHSHGIDDLRPLFHEAGRELDLYMDEHTHEALNQRFSYVFAGHSGYPATAKAHLIKSEMQFGPITVRPFRQLHGSIFSQGYRFEYGGKAVAYSTDLSGIPDESWQHLEGLNLWIVDALRRNPHPTHSHLAQTLKWIEKVQPKEAWLTHMDQSMDHDQLLEELPPRVSPGYDGRRWTSI